MSDVAAKASFRRWILPGLSLAPVTIGIFGVVFKGAGDSGGAEMALGFFFFPIAFVLGVAAAIIGWKRRKIWSKLDVAVGFAPLLVYAALILFVVAAVVFNWNF